jgi:hypothetical protein
MPGGFSVAIDTSSNTGVIATNGTIAPPTTATTVDLTLTVTRTGDGTTATTGSIAVIVPVALSNNTGSGGSGSGGTSSYPPVVQAEAASTITDGSVVLNGAITSDNGYAVTDYGFLWGTSASSLTNKLDAGTSNLSGAFTATLSSLAAGTTYYFEAYATNAQGTTDGTVMSFTTTGTAQTAVTPATTPTFSDVSAAYWAYDAIGNLSELGYISGYPDGAFRPDQPITRAEVAAIMDKMLKLTPYTPKGQVFNDVNPDDWFYQAVETANHAGIEIGYHDGTFHPNAPISRQEIACVLVQALGKAQLADSLANTVTKFVDNSSIAWWSRGFVSVEVQQGIVSGYPDGTFLPKVDTTRAEACAMIVNFLNAEK